MKKKGRLKTLNPQSMIWVNYAHKIENPKRIFTKSLSKKIIKNKIQKIKNNNNNNK